MVENRPYRDFFAHAVLITGVLLVAFRNDSLKPLTGKSLAEVARLRGKSPEELFPGALVRAYRESERSRMEPEGV